MMAFGRDDVCRHGGLRRKCEPCDLEEERDELRAQVADLTRQLAVERQRGQEAKALMDSMEKGRAEHQKALAGVRRVLDEAAVPTCPTCGDAKASTSMYCERCSQAKRKAAAVPTEPTCPTCSEPHRRGSVCSDAFHYRAGLIAAGFPALAATVDTLEQLASAHPEDSKLARMVEQAQAELVVARVAAVPTREAGER